MKKLRITAVLLVFLTAQVFLGLSNASGASAGRIKIVTAPEGARVFINGEFFGRTPFRTRLYPGTYDVRLEKDGYQTFRTSVDVPYKKRVEISHYFEKRYLYGNLRIRSYPPGAEIIVDDKYYGKTPESIRLRRGQHQIRLEKENYKPYVQLVDVYANKKTDMDADMVPLQRKGVVRITSTPSSARVMINGSYYNKTPMEVTLRAGVYTVKLIKKGFKPLNTKMSVRAGQVNQKSFGLKREPPPKREGRVIIYSNPEGASVFFRNREMGTTPMKSSLNEGGYLIEIKKKGYKTYKKQIHVTPWETLYVNADLERETSHHEYGMVHISAHPKGGKIVVNGNYYGISPLSLRLTPGKHIIRIKKRGYQTYEQNIRIKPYREHYVNADLVRIFPGQHSNGKLSIVSKPLGSNVYINKVHKGKTPLEIELPADIYTLEIRHKGFHNYKKQISILPGKTHYIKTNLDWTGYKKHTENGIQIFDDETGRVKP